MMLRRLRRSQRGSMPFAVIAVTLLLMAGTLGSVYAYMERNRENVDNIQSEFDAFDSSVNDLESSLNTGLGIIISDMSQEDIQGGAVGMFDEFSKRAGSWLEFMFPLTVGAATAHLISHDVELGTESLMLSTGTETEASMPVFLKAKGTVKVNISSNSVSSEVDLNIDSDALSGLPFVMERSTLFQLASEGPESLLNDLIAYQLAALAQYRVLQGVGSMNEYGEYGSRNIITPEDVMSSYRNAMRVIEMINFRTNSDGIAVLGDRIDIAEYALLENDMVELDLTAIYAQTISLMMDELVVQWMDYFMTSKILDCIDSILDGLSNISEKVKDALRSIAGIFGRSGPQKVTAGSYLKSVMNDAGFEDQDYRYVMNGGFSSSVPAQTIKMTVPNGHVSISLPEIGFRAQYPDVDVVEWIGWDGFLSSYRDSSNVIRESLKGILNSVCIKLSSSYGLGKVTVPIDPYDDVGFTDTLSEIVSDTMTEQRKNVERSAEEYLRSQPFHDPMYGSMFRMLNEQRDSAFGKEQLLENIRHSAEDAILEHIRKTCGEPLDTSFLDDVLDSVMDSPSVKRIVKDYDGKVDSSISKMDSILNSVVSKNSAMKEIFSYILSEGLIFTKVFDRAVPRITELCEEISSHISSMSTGIISIPTDREFTVMDTSGNIRSERFVMNRTDDLVVSVGTPHDSYGTHMIGVFSDDTDSAPYTAVFTASLHGKVDVDVRSYSPYSELIGKSDSSYSVTMPIDIDIDVPVITAWALAGIEYKASRDLFGDVKDIAYRLAMEIVRPLIGPLREFTDLAKHAFMKISSAMFEYTSYMNSLVKELYDFIMGYVDSIRDKLESRLSLIAGPIEGFMKLGLTKQEFGIRFHEFELKINMNAGDLLLKKKTLLSVSLIVPLGKTSLTVSFDIKKGDDGYSVAGSASFVSDTWNAVITLDPFMKLKKHVIEISGTVRNTEFHITIPELVQYDVLEFRLSDVPGVGTMLSNIPLPMPGVKGSIDAGVQLKYNTPYKHGLVINEFDSNPKGTDNGKEWVELYNSSSDTIDLDGYRIVPGTGEKKAYTISDVTISPGEHLVIELPKQILNNSSGVNGPGERVILLDAEENEVDKTPWKTDDKNDDQSWQRAGDGSTEWVFKTNSKGKPNGGKLMGGNQLKIMLRDCILEAVQESFKELGDITDTDGISKMMERIVRLTIEKAIEKIAQCVVEATVFIEVEFSDVTGSGHLGIRLALAAKGDLVENGLKWIAGEIMGMMGIIENPSGLEPKTIISEDVFIQSSVYTGISAPKILDKNGTEVRATLVVECNVSAVCSLIGKDIGRWNVNVGLKIEDIPTAMVPSGLKADKEKHADLWLIKAEFARAS